MQLTAILLLSLATYAAVAYVLNDVERGAIDCIRYRYDDLLGNGNQMGKLQIGCLDQNQHFDNLWIAGTTKNRLPPFRKGSKCDHSSRLKPYFLNELLYCAYKLLEANCGKETTATDKDKNIQELIDTITPKQTTCAPLYVMTKLELAALDCIHHSIESIRGAKGTLDVDCKNGKFDILRLFFIPATDSTAVQLEDGGALCKSSTANGLNFGKRAVECAKRLLEELCTRAPPQEKSETIHVGFLGDFIVKVRPKERRVCNDDA